VELKGESTCGNECLQFLQEETSVQPIKSGFGYNSSDGSCDVPDDVWSRRYVSANPGAAAYKNRPLELYSELHEIFNHAVATGEFWISTLVAAPMPDVGGVANDLGIENVAAVSVPRTETAVSDGDGGTVDGSRCCAQRICTTQPSSGAK
jgi:hypothetical protein